jgi:hypothetical protein
LEQFSLYPSLAPLGINCSKVEHKELDEFKIISTVLLSAQLKAKSDDEE